ncbi:FecR/PupR family sigma factor regulator [Pseudomonas shirazensis]|uniref:FecR/PupR family sigma factor regulator n=1 Tax=Pseudomonas shirazensis TaxID=2745494 RepID=UPI003D2D22ED
MRLRDQPHHPELQAQLMAWRQRDGRHELAWLRWASWRVSLTPGGYRTQRRPRQCYAGPRLMWVDGGCCRCLGWVWRLAVAPCC